MRQKKILIFISLAFSLFLSRCSPAETDYTEDYCKDAGLFSIHSQLSDSTIVFCGLVNEQSYKKLINTQLLNIDKVRISSLGGDPVSAFKIADYLNENKIQVIFDSLCASACLTIFKYADSVVVDSNALFLDHPNLSEKVYYIERALNKERAKKNSLDVSFINQSIEIAKVLNPELFEKNEIKHLLLANLVQTNVQCMGAIINGRVMMSYQGTSLQKQAYDGWLLPIEHLKNLKEAFPGNAILPTSWDKKRDLRYADFLSTLNLNRKTPYIPTLEAEYEKIITNAKLCEFSSFDSVRK